MSSKKILPPYQCPYRGQLLAGVDEAGRGPLAGDVVAAAVILDPARPIAGVDDSKKLSEKKRELLFDEIEEKAWAFAVARASVEEIDRLNILQASLLAMHRAVQQLTLQPEFVLVDGNKKPAWDYPCDTVVQGDGRVAAIAAASILAKVTRDREMLALDRRYPGYNFGGHKGYPTKLHIQALEQHGVTPVHRRSFAPVRRQLALRAAAASLDLAVL